MGVLPAFGLYLFFRLLKFFAQNCTAADFFGELGTFFGLLLLVVLLAGKLLHREFIPGTSYFWNRIGPLLFVACLVLFDLYWAYLSIKVVLSKTNSIRVRVAALVSVLSEPFAVWDFVEFFQPGKGNPTPGFWAILLWFIGPMLYPKPDKAKAEPGTAA